MHSILINWDLNLGLVWFGLRTLVNFCILFSTNEHVFKETYTNKGSIYKSWKITLLQFYCGNFQPSLCLYLKHIRGSFQLCPLGTPSVAQDSFSPPSSLPLFYSLENMIFPPWIRFALAILSQLILHFSIIITTSSPHWTTMMVIIIILILCCYSCLRF